MATQAPFPPPPLTPLLCVKQVHFGLMLVVLSSSPGQYPFSHVRFMFDYTGYVAASLVFATLLHLLVR